MRFTIALLLAVASGTLAASVMLAATTTNAHAGCPTLKSLDSPDGNCLDNGNYVDAGISCFLDFENLVKEKAGIADKDMKKSNKKNVLSDKNSQQQDFLAAMADFKIASGTLDQLIALGKSTVTNLDGYSKNIYFPEDWDAPPEVIGPPWTFALENPCFGEPREMLIDMKDRAEKYVAQLEAAKKAVTAMNTKADDRETKIDQIAGARQPAAKTKSKGPKNFVKKKHPKRESTVTGELFKDQLPNPIKK